MISCTSVAEILLILSSELRGVWSSMKACGRQEEAGLWQGQENSQWVVKSSPTVVNRDINTGSSFATTAKQKTILTKSFCRCSPTCQQFVRLTIEPQVSTCLCLLINEIINGGGSHYTCLKKWVLSSIPRFPCLHYQLRYPISKYLSFNYFISNILPMFLILL